MTKSTPFMVSARAGASPISVQFTSRATKNVILRAAKDLGLRRLRPFAALRVTRYGRPPDDHRGPSRVGFFETRRSSEAVILVSRSPERSEGAAKDLLLGRAQILRCAQDDSSPSVRASGGKPRPGSYLSFNPTRCSIYNTREYMYITGDNPYGNGNRRRTTGAAG